MSELRMRNGSTVTFQSYGEGVEDFECVGSLMVWDVTQAEWDAMTDAEREQFRRAERILFGSEVSDE